MMRFFSILNSTAITLAVVFLAFGVLSHFHVPVGHFGDWVVGLLAGVWLLAVVVVPWDVYFRAKAVMADAASSRDRGLKVDERQVAYVKRVAGISLATAIGLHIGSAAVLFVLAVTGVSQIGYAASVVALLLTALRPAASAYRYLADRLRTIGDGWKYPIEDVLELRQRVAVVEASGKRFDAELDTQNAESLIMRQRATEERLRQAEAESAAAVEALRASNDEDHDRLSRECKSAVGQISADGQFLDHVREIIRFYKSA